MLDRPVTENYSFRFSCVRTHTVQSCVRQTSAHFPKWKTYFSFEQMLNLWFHDAFLMYYFSVYQALVFLDANRERMYFDETFVKRSLCELICEVKRNLH